MSHQNVCGVCDGCEAIFSRYDGFNTELRLWFYSVRGSFPDAHISDAGRGHVLQEVYFQRGASDAHYTQSAHNWNAAIDMWQNVNGVYTLNRQWFLDVFAKCPIDDKFEWYGANGARFHEVPHVQVLNWRDLAQKGYLQLVEPAPGA